MPMPQQPGDTTRLGSVVSVTPLRVRLDGDTDPIPCDLTLVHKDYLGTGSYVSVLIRRLQWGAMQAIVTGLVTGVAPPVIPPPYTPTTLPPPVEYTNSGSFSTASTNYVYQSSVCSKGLFTAPPSGRVLVIGTILARATTAGQAAGASWEILDYSTNAVVVAHDPAKNSALNYNTQYVSVSRQRLVTGLTPGSFYTIQQLALIGAGGGLLAWSSITVVPIAQNS